MLITLVMYVLISNSPSMLAVTCNYVFINDHWFYIIKRNVNHLIIFWRGKQALFGIITFRDWPDFWSFFKSGIRPRIKVSIPISLVSVLAQARYLYFLLFVIWFNNSVRALINALNSSWRLFEAHRHGRARRRGEISKVQKTYLCYMLQGKKLNQKSKKKKFNFMWTDGNL